jgi:hypothetical protein
MSPETCNSAPTPCYFFNPAPTSCANQRGCVYDYGTSACNGSATPCANFTTQGACFLQDGCRWSGTTTCSGVPTACEELPTSTCANTPGCRLSF